MTGWDVTLPHHRAQQTRDEAEVDGGHGVEQGDGAASGSRKQVPSNMETAPTFSPFCEKYLNTWAKVRKND